MSYQRHGYSGQEYDRWVGRNSNKSAMGKVQKQFWFTKSAVLRKFGKKEDEHIVASDAELDAKIDLFNAIEETTRELRNLIAEYQTKLCVLAQEENSLGKLLKEYGKEDQTKAGKMMVAIGKTFNCTAQHRIGMRTPLVRLYQEVDTFHVRAVEDTHRTVHEMEKVRTEYRGSLMWMKNISQDFNPDHYQQLEKFREVQTIVKRKKGRFDLLKVKCLQKIDLLAASRCNMFSHALILYQNNLITFSKKTAKTLTDISSNFQGYEPYKFQVIKELSDPLDDSSEIKDSEPKDLNNIEQNNADKSEADSLINLLDQSEVESGNSIGTDNKINDFSNIDLLTDNANSNTDLENAQLLKELFDSPVHKYQQKHSLPIFGCSDINSVEDNLQANENVEYKEKQQNAHQFFLPSQLIDFGFNKSETLNSSIQSALDLKLPKENISSVKNLSTVRKSVTPLQDVEPSKNKLVNQTNKESSKLDWYKVFQEIDPLTDIGNDIFLKGFDKQC